jgi:hypothetical protein
VPVAPPPSFHSATAVGAIPGASPQMEGSLAQLTSLGFSRQDAIDALRRAGNDVQGAASLLLG